MPLPEFADTCACLVAVATKNKTLEEEARLANELGLSATYVDSVPLQSRGITVPKPSAVPSSKVRSRFAQAHSGQGSHVFERTEAEEFSGNEPIEIKANGHSIHCSTSSSRQTYLWWEERTSPALAAVPDQADTYSTYVIRLDEGSRGPPSLSGIRTDPYFFLRIGSACRMYIFGGVGPQDRPGRPTRRIGMSILESMLRRILSQGPHHSN